MLPHDRRITALTLALGALCAVVFAGLVVLYGRELRTDIRHKMIERDAAVLYPVAQQQIQATTSLAALLPDARRQGTLALAIFDEAGVTLETIPANQPLAELPLDDLVQLQNGRPLTRFHPEFPLSRLQAGVPVGKASPVLEIILPLYRRPDSGGQSLLGFVRYHLDARPLAAELAALDENVADKTRFTLLLGVCLIGLIVLAAHLALRSAQRTITERTERLQHANFELTLSTKASALGQITSHLIHGLQGSVAGLHTVMAGRAPKDRDADWQSAAGYMTRMQGIIHEAISLLGDSAQTAYLLTGHELLAIIQQRNAAAAELKGVAFSIRGGFADSLDSHRGGLVCLIAKNLVENAIAATAAGRTVTVSFQCEGEQVVLWVMDEGHGISDQLRAHLFEPGRSERSGGTGLGLAISQLLARQIGATLALDSTGPTGTTFRVSLPLRKAE